MRQTRADRLEASGVEVSKVSEKAPATVRCTFVRWTDANSVPISLVGQALKSQVHRRNPWDGCPGTTPDNVRKRYRSPTPPEIELVNTTERPYSTAAEEKMPLP